MAIADVLEFSARRATLAEDLAELGIAVLPTHVALRHKEEVLEEHGGHWWRCRYLPASLDDFDMPVRLRRRADRAARLSRVKIVIERHDIDPLLMATRFDWRRFRNEVAYIGGWKTGNLLIDRW